MSMEETARLELEILREHLKHKKLINEELQARIGLLRAKAKKTSP